jgi:hypothetical protein
MNLTRPMFTTPQPDPIDLELDNTDFDDGIEVGDYDLKSVPVENDPPEFREAAKETGGQNVYISFNDAVETIYSLVKNDSWVHKINDNLRVLSSNAVYHNDVIEELKPQVTTPSPVTTTTQTYLDDISVNKKVNLLLNTLKEYKMKFNIDFEARAKIGSAFLYTHDNKVNEQINHILVELNMIKLIYGLNDPYRNFYKTELGLTDDQAIEHEMPKAEHLKGDESDFLSFLSWSEFKTASISACMVIVAFLPCTIFMCVKK